MNSFTKSIDYSQLVEQAPIGLMISDRHKILYANPYLFRMLDRNTNDTLSWNNILIPECLDHCLEKINNVCDKKVSIEHLMIKLITNNGILIEVGMTITPYYLNDNVFAQIQVERSNYIKREVHDYVDNVISEKVIELAVDGTIISTLTSSHIFGYTPTELLGKRYTNFLHQNDKAAFLESFQNLLAEHNFSLQKHRFISKDGNYVWVDGKGKLINNKHNKMILLGLHNLSKQIETENLLKQSEKLAIIGELAAGVVHEIKNPLTSIKGFLQLMQAGTIKTTDYIEILNGEIERIEQIASDLLSFAKPSEEMKEQELNEILQEVIFLLQVQASKRDVKIEWKNQDKKYIVYGDKSQLKQVFINLIKNAIEASDYASTIDVSCYRQDGYYMINIQDYGHGIPKDKLMKIGDSFFTTKEKGTGLGLMVSHKIVKNHHGTIKVESELGKGSTFKVCLPIFTDA